MVILIVFYSGITGINALVAIAGAGVGMICSAGYRKR